MSHHEYLVSRARMVFQPSLTDIQKNENLTSSMDIEKLKILFSTFANVLETLLKRKNSTERHQVLEEFQNLYPNEFKKWFTADVQRYLEGLRY